MSKKVIMVMILTLVIVLVAAGTVLASKNHQNVESDQPIQGTVVDVEQGIDGVMVELETDDGEIYSVTISGIQAEVIGRWENIKEGAELAVSGEVIEGMEPTLITASHVRVLGIDPDQVTNLWGMVTEIDSGTDGITATLESSDGTIYRTAISIVTSEILYIGDNKEIIEGSSLLISGELMDLDGPYIVADMVVVEPIMITEMEPGEGNE